ncbi:hypothetical protein R51_03540 [Bacillus safensis]|uniref:hypothetical protein n=1 Tax=Bacillus safensis TaxID=561879 RepID=UPI0023E93DCC|nr:hypothetical protein [Bacillus safensis]GLF85309.1 hypothetical protein R51_03540 [Bacillus safensis]
MLDLLNVILTIIASTLSIIGFITTRDNKKDKTEKKGNDNKIDIGETKTIKKVFQPTVQQSLKIIHKIENPSNETEILKMVAWFIVSVLFGIIYFSYLNFFNMILLLIFNIRFISYVRASLAIKTLNKPFSELKFMLTFINMLVLLGLIFSLLLLPIPKELTEIDKDLKFNISIIFQGGNSISSWLESVSAYIKSIWGKDVLFYLVGRSTGFIFITIFIIMSTTRRALPTVKEGEKTFTIFSESMFIPIFVIMLIFCFLFPWIAFDIKDQLYPYWDEWLKG